MQPMTILVRDWAIRCFGYDHVVNPRVRSLRLAEEAVELCQALNVPKEKLEDLIQIVYSRPKGEVVKELGGVAMTATVMAASLGKDLDAFLFDEFRRVLQKSPEHFAQRNQEKLGLGLTGA
jgi:NTP pyrophosphatase (non-canonical NTP hydrolase)